jgi:hypothetical protein
MASETRPSATHIPAAVPNHTDRRHRASAPKTAAATKFTATAVREFPTKINTL